LTLDSPDLVAAQSDYLKAKSAVGQSNKTLARQRDLLSHGIGAQRDLDQAQTDHDTAQSELDRATIRLRLLGIDPGGLGQALTLRSPIAGRVVEFKVAQGDYRSDLSEVMMTVADLSMVWVTAHVQEKDIRRVHDGSEAVAAFAAYPGESWPGKVQFVGDLLDPTTRTISVRIVMANAERRLRPGMFAAVTFVETAASELAVPTAAVVLIGDTNYVFVETAPWTFRRRKVVPRVQAGSFSLLSDGVKAGERVITENAVVLQ
jgi:cobalt-zinc-cadmium efflux system membrane fusion protein